MKFNDACERQIVRIRPTLVQRFAVGRIIDLLPQERLRVLWIVPPKGCDHNMSIHAATDLLQIPEDQAQVVRELSNQHKTSTGLYKAAIEAALEYWLDLRRDGIESSVRELGENIVRLHQHLVERAKGVSNGRTQNP